MVNVSTQVYTGISWLQESGILQRIEQYKPVFQEPRRKADFNPVCYWWRTPRCPVLLQKCVVYLLMS